MLAFDAKRISKITTIGIAGLIGEAIKRIHRGESVGALFSSEVSLTQELLLWEDGVARAVDTRDDDDRGPTELQPIAIPPQLAEARAADR